MPRTKRTSGRVSATHRARNVPERSWWRRNRQFVAIVAIAALALVMIWLLAMPVPGH